MKTASDIRFIIQKNLEIVKNDNKKDLDSLLKVFNNNVHGRMLAQVETEIDAQLAGVTDPKDFRVLVNIDPSFLYPFNKKQKEAYLSYGFGADATFHNLSTVPENTVNETAHLTQVHLGLKVTTLIQSFLDSLNAAGFVIDEYIVNDAKTLDHFNFSLVLKLA